MNREEKKSGRFTSSELLIELDSEKEARGRRENLGTLSQTNKQKEEERVGLVPPPRDGELRPGRGRGGGGGLRAAEAPLRQRARAGKEQRGGERGLRPPFVGCGGGDDYVLRCRARLRREAQI